MPIRKCQNCNYVIIDPSSPCSSCGNMYVESSVKPPVQSPAFNDSLANSPVFSSVDEPNFSVFSIGKVLSLSFSTFFKHPFVFMGLCLLAQIPGLVVAALTRGAEVGWISSVISFILWWIIQGAIAYGVYEALRGKPARFGESLSQGTERIINITLAALACTVAIAGVLAASYALILIMAFGFIASPIFLLLAWLMARFIPMMLAALLGAAFFALSIFFGGGIIVFIVIPSMLVAMAWLGCKWIVIAPVCVVERVDPIESLSRSSELTEGYRWQIVALYTLNLVIIFAISFVLGFIIAVFAGGFDPVFTILLERLVAVVPMAFSSVMVAVIYYELRSVKEGVSIDSLADVFD